MANSICNLGGNGFFNTLKSDFNQKFKMAEAREMRYMEREIFGEHSGENKVRNNFLFNSDPQKNS